MRLRIRQQAATHLTKGLGNIVGAKTLGKMTLNIMTYRILGSE